MLACGVVCCSHQSDRRIRVWVSHQSYHSIFLVKDFMESGGWGTKNGVNQKFWVHAVYAMVVAFVQAFSIEVENSRDMKGSHLFLLQYHFFLHLYKIAIYLWLGSIGDTTLSTCFLL